MRCHVCRQKFTDGAHIVPIVQFVADSGRGDFATSIPDAYAHVTCLTNGAA